MYSNAKLFSSHRSDSQLVPAASNVLKVCRLQHDLVTAHVLAHDFQSARLWHACHVAVQARTRLVWCQRT